MNAHRRLTNPTVLLVVLLLAAATRADIPNQFKGFGEIKYQSLTNKKEIHELQGWNESDIMDTVYLVGWFDTSGPLMEDQYAEDRERVREARALPPTPGRGTSDSILSPSGGSLWVVNSASNQVSAFSVDLATGNASAVDGGLYATGNTPARGAVDPSGRFLYVTNVFSNSVSAYRVNIETSQLTPIGEFPAGDAPQAIGASRRFVFVTDLGFNTGVYTLTVLRIDPQTGSLTPVAGSPYTLGAGAPFQLVVSPEGRFVYTSGIHGFVVDPDTGGLSPIGGLPALNTFGMAIHPKLPYLYVASDTEIHSYAFDYFTGALTELGPPLATDQYSFLTVQLDGESMASASPQTSLLHTFSIDRSTGIPAENGPAFAMRTVPSGIGAGGTPLGSLAARGVAYSHAIVADGGTPPYKFSITDGTLPAGLSISAQTGTVSGTPTQNGTSTFLVQSRDALGSLAFHTYTIQVVDPAAAPAAPSQLTATPVSSTQVALTWHDNAAEQAVFSVEASLDGGPFRIVDGAASFQTSRTIEGLSPASAYSFRIQAKGVGGASAYTDAVAATTAPQSPTPCVASETAACLAGGRFLLEAMFQTSRGEVGPAHVVPLTSDTAYLWFFSQSNVEAVVKILDACAIGDHHFWLFAGGLTDVRVALRITDMATGAVRDYENAISTPFQPVQATNAFGTCSAAAPVTGGEPDSAFVPPPLSDEAASWSLPAASATCTPGDTAMCLNDARYRVEATYHTKDGRTGPAHMHQITPDTGYMWFFNENNVEAVVKILDGCLIGGHRWVFAGGLTNVDVQMTVTDTVTGAAKPYHNPQGTPFQPIQDTSAFDCP